MKTKNSGEKESHELKYQPPEKQILGFLLNPHHWQI